MDRGIELVDLSRIESINATIMVSNIKTEALINGSTMQKGPMSVVGVTKGGLSKNFILSSLSGVRVTGVSQSLIESDESMMIVGEYEEEVKMCGGGRALEAREGSLHGSSGFWASFPLSSSSSSQHYSFGPCPYNTRSIRPTRSSGAENCKVSNLKVLALPKLTTSQDEKDMNFIAHRMTGCNSDEVLKDSQSGFGVIELSSASVASSDEEPLPKVLFTSDAIEWTIEVMEEEKGREEWEIASPLDQINFPPTHQDDPSSTIHRVWVGGHASPMSRDCSQQSSEICKFSTTSPNPSIALSIHEKGVWFALLLVDAKIGGSTTLEKMFFIPDHSHAISLSFHKMKDVSSSKRNPKPLPNTVTFVTQKQNEIFGTSFFSPPSPTPPSPSSPVTFEPAHSKVIPLADPTQTTAATILHVSSFIAPQRIIQSSSNDAPSKTSARGVVVTWKKQGSGEGTISFISQITPSKPTTSEFYDQITNRLIISFTPYEMRNVTPEEERRREEDSSLEETQLLQTDSGISIKRIFAVGIENGGSATEGRLMTTSLSFISSPFKGSFLSSIPILYPKTVDNQQPLVPTPNPVPSPPPPPTVIPPAPTTTAPVPSSSPTQAPSASPSPIVEGPTEPLYRGPTPLSSSSKWVIVALSFLSLSLLAYFAIRYYLNRRIAALQASHHRLESSPSSSPSSPLSSSSQLPSSPHDLDP